jgi:hypothetical protein
LLPVAVFTDPLADSLELLLLVVTVVSCCVFSEGDVCFFTQTRGMNNRNVRLKSLLEMSFFMRYSFKVAVRAGDDVFKGGTVNALQSK